ncbi:MAG: endolytic transglycosylase MltG [Symbiobacteriaceae bacterium]|nr:endolytic transglycosylase MltG [Symbiobacteriaceae bacterium]
MTDGCTYFFKAVVILEAAPSPTQPGGNSHVGKIFLALVAVAILSGVLYWNYLESRKVAIYDESGLKDTLVELRIPAGASVGDIASLLAEHGVIKDASLFRQYNASSGYGSRLQAGLYEFNLGMSVAGATAKLVAGDIKRTYYTFSIPEGSNIYQIAAGAERQGFCSQEEFLAAVLASDLRQAPPEVIFPLEGYLYPATYFFDYIPEPEELLATFYQEAIKRHQQLELPPDHPLTLDEVIILASVLEKESQYDEERHRVAGVFMNRLAIDMPLQSCATVNYVLPEFKEVLTWEDTTVVSPYNTYLYPGLPLGPISCPSEMALEAVLHPEETDYYFFVVSSDGTHHFSRTYEEHLAAAAWLGE